MLPHQKRDEGSIDAALGDEDAVGEFGSLCDLQIFLCREHSDIQKASHHCTVYGACSHIVPFVAVCRIRDLPLVRALGTGAKRGINTGRWLFPTTSDRSGFCDI